MLSFLGELGSDEEMLDLLLLLDEEFSSFLAEKVKAVKLEHFAYFASLDVVSALGLKLSNEMFSQSTSHSFQSI